MFWTLEPLLSRVEVAEDGKLHDCFFLEPGLDAVPVKAINRVLVQVDVYLGLVDLAFGSVCVGFLIA